MKRGVRRARRSEGSVSDGRLARLLEVLDDGRARDLVVISLRDLGEASAMADYMVIASGTSHRHVGSLAERAALLWKSLDGASPGIEGLPRCDWVLVDGGDVILHVFRPEVRSYYDLEGMWSAPGGEKK